MPIGGAQSRTATFNYIQACRAAAAIAVVMFHISVTFAAAKYFNEPIFAQLLRFGSAGVEFFFVLSGFIIYFIHHRDIGNPMALGRFFRRRIERIYPSYWLIFAGVAGFALLVPIFRAGVPTDPVVLVKSLLLLPQDPAVVGGTGAPVIIVAWSLQYEMVFYLLFGIFIVSRGIGIGCLAALALWWLAIARGWVESYFKLHYFLIFAFGVASGWFVRRNFIASPHAMLAIGIVVFFAFAFYEVMEMILGNLPQVPPRHGLVSVGYGVGSAFIVAGLVALESLHGETAFVSKGRAALLGLGDASYVLYLLHYPVISACAKLLTRVDGGLLWVGASFLLTLVICCGVALVFHSLIERPLLEIFRRWHS